MNRALWIAPNKLVRTGYVIINIALKQRRIQYREVLDFSYIHGILIQERFFPTALFVVSNEAKEKI